jgi:hypothetical protein
MAPTAMLATMRRKIVPEALRPITRVLRSFPAIALSLSAADEVYASRRRRERRRIIAGTTASGDKSASLDAVDSQVVAPVKQKSGFHFFARRSRVVAAGAGRAPFLRPV